jgi:nitric oxide reductase NorE protein
MTDLAEKNKRARFVPGQPDMWAFVLFETLVFTAYFGFYLFYRTLSPELFLHSQSQLDLRIGVFNTLVLLLSSWSVVRCVQSSRAGAYRAALRDAFVTAAFAAVFLFFKVFEWVRLVRMGNGLDSNDFFTYYFFLTGIHFVHLLIGFVALGIVVYQLRSPARQDRKRQENIETCATYWHTVDFLWVLIFALLYVVR